MLERVDSLITWRNSDKLPLTEPSSQVFLTPVRASVYPRIELNFLSRVGGTNDVVEGPVIQMSEGVSMGCDSNRLIRICSREDSSCDDNVEWLFRRRRQRSGRGTQGDADGYGRGWRTNRVQERRSSSRLSL
jgi:hypothetical protein